MKLRIELLLIALVSYLLMGCSSTENIPFVEDSFPDFDIKGQWAIISDDNWENEIMFDFRTVADTDYQLKVWGKNAQLDSIKIGQQQFIFSYVADGNQKFSVLGTILSDNQIKLSRISEAVDDFQPLGRLGQRVYYLQKLNEGIPHMLTKAPVRNRYRKRF